ncbi:receptor-type tyrosine-protein phosphatase gamma-like isoform X1 [Lampetra fluviatilis]
MRRLGCAHGRAPGSGTRAGRGPLRSGGRLLSTAAVLCLLAGLFCTPAGAAMEPQDGKEQRGARDDREETDWTYTGEGGVLAWPSRYPECNGSQQSPIDLVPEEAVPDRRLGPLRLEGWERATGPRTLIKNTGKTVEVWIDGDYFLWSGGTRWRATRLAFHWGSCSSADGSEHQIDGRSFPLEMQIFLHDTNRTDAWGVPPAAPSATGDAGGSNAHALAVLFQVSKQENPAYSAIISGLASVAHHEKSSAMSTLVPRALLPEDTGDYFRYAGSLTAPPCREGLLWTVLRMPVPISRSQLSRFCGIFTTERLGFSKVVDYLRDNFRPVQAGFSGAVFTSRANRTGPVCTAVPQRVWVEESDWSTVRVRWGRARVVAGGDAASVAVVMYAVSMERSGEGRRLTRRTHGETDTSLMWQNVSAGVTYLVRVQAVCQGDLLGPSTRAIRFHLGSDGTEQQTRDRQMGSDVTDWRLPLAVVSSLTCLCVILLIALLIYWRKCFQTAHLYIDDINSPRVVPPSSLPFLPFPEEVDGIPVKQFPKHVAELQASGSGFASEFEEIERSTLDFGIPTDDGKQKPRYMSNMAAYDHTRVRLRTPPGRDGKSTELICANYVDGFNRPRAYIATQGPARPAFADFWQMVWEQNVGTIVMLSGPGESFAGKAEKYWPAEGSEEYGSVLVTLKSSRARAFYTARRFHIRNTKFKKGSQRCRVPERVVCHWAFSARHAMEGPPTPLGGPSVAWPLLAFVRKASAGTRAQGAGPTLVHCGGPSRPSLLELSVSADPVTPAAPPSSNAPTSGCGMRGCAGGCAVGTFVVLDSMLQQVRERGALNVPAFLRHARTQRAHLVHSPEQYAFIHEALVGAVTCRDTEVPAGSLHAYVNRILTPHAKTGHTAMHKQSRLLTGTGGGGSRHGECTSAGKACNRVKNRANAVLPAEHSRVLLSPIPGVEGSDYINASYVTGFNKQREFIITQRPLAHTAQDFWRMTWEVNARFIVMLQGNDASADAEAPYWPAREGSSVPCDGFTVLLRSERRLTLANEGPFVIADLLLRADKGDREVEVRHLRCPPWPNPDAPISSCFELVGVARDEGAARDGPIIIHDQCGGNAAGTLVALATLWHQLEEDGSADVFLAAKMVSLARPGTFTDAEQYQFLYKAVLSLVASRETRNGCAAPDRNGAAVLPDEPDPAESMESLV